MFVAKSAAPTMNQRKDRPARKYSWLELRLRRLAQSPRNMMPRR